MTGGCTGAGEMIKIAGAAEDGDRRVEDEQMNNKACESRTEEVSMTAVKAHKQIGGATNSMWTWY